MFGGSGYLGRAVVPHLGRNWTVEAPTHGEVELLSQADVERCVRDHQPQAIVNLAAATPGSPDFAVNEEGARFVAEAAQVRGVRLVHISTDMVLDGRTPPYADDAPARPLNSYGRSKAVGENIVLASGADAAIVRTSLIWDPHEIDRATRGFAERLTRGEAVGLFTDEVRCPVTRETLAAAIAALLETPWRGTLNVAGREAITRHDFSVLLLEHFRIEGREHVARAAAADLDLPTDEQRPSDLTLDVSRAEELLGVPMRGVRVVLADA